MVEKICGCPPNGHLKGCSLQHKPELERALVELVERERWFVAPVGPVLDVRCHCNDMQWQTAGVSTFGCDGCGSRFEVRIKGLAS